MEERHSSKPVRDTAGNAAAWVAGAVASLAYVAVTSRSFTPETIGGYASGVLAELLVYLAIGSGLPVAVQRRSDLTESDEAAFIGRAILAGAGGAVVLLAGAGLWADIWHNPESAGFTRALATVALLHPVSLVCLGILRRHDRHVSAARVLAVAGVGSSLLGAIPVLLIGSSLTLVVSNLLVAVLTIGACAAAGVRLRPRFTKRLPDSGFARSTVILNLVNYAAYNAPAWSVSRFISVSTLGLYSRSWLLADLPAQGMASSASQVLFPSFSRESVEGNRRIASDALTAVAAFASAGLATIGSLSSLIVIAVLGRGWLDSIPLLAVLAISLAAMAPHWVLASQLQAQHRFDLLTRSRAAAVAAAATVVALVAATGEPMIAAAGGGFVHAAGHSVDLRSASRLGLVDPGPVLRGYLEAAWACVGLWAIALAQATGAWSPRGASGLVLLCVATTASLLFAAVTILRGSPGAVLESRRSIPPWIPSFARPKRSLPVT